MNEENLYHIKDEEGILYEIESSDNDYSVIKGKTSRVKRKVPTSSLVKATNFSELEKEKKVFNRISKNERINTLPFFGTILHLDTDTDYLNSCLKLYKELHIQAWGISANPERFSDIIDKAITDVTPDIVVITGHDYYNQKDIKDLNNYENTNHFIKALRKIRARADKDSIIVISGACGSNYEALMANGSNFASSPKRKNIHTYDPAVIAIKCATTSFTRIVNFDECLKYIENGKDAFGGIETKGKMRLFL